MNTLTPQNNCAIMHEDRPRDVTVLIGEAELHIAHEIGRKLVEFVAERENELSGLMGRLIIDFDGKRGTIKPKVEVVMVWHLSPHYELPANAGTKDE